LQAFVDARAQDAHGDLAAVRDQDARDPAHSRGHASGSIAISGWPYSTRAPFSARIARTVPATGATMWVISFFTSTIASVSSAARRVPTATNGGAPGEGERQKRPTDGDSTSIPVSGSGVACAGSACTDSGDAVSSGAGAAPGSDAVVAPRS